jgi:hypothetical protein
MLNMGIPQIRMELRKRRTWAREKLVIERLRSGAAQNASLHGHWSLAPA